MYVLCYIIALLFIIVAVNSPDIVSKIGYNIVGVLWLIIGKLDEIKKGIDK